MCFPMVPVSHMASTQLSYAGHNVLPYGPWISKASTLLSYAGPNVLPYGPWISNGILDRGNKAEGLVAQRMGKFRKVRNQS